MKKAEKPKAQNWGGAFLPKNQIQIQECLFFSASIDSYYMDLSCCKRITKSFVM